MSNIRVLTKQGIDCTPKKLGEHGRASEPGTGRSRVVRWVVGGTRVVGSTGHGALVPPTPWYGSGYTNPLHGSVYPPSWIRGTLLDPFGTVFDTVLGPV